MKTRPQGSGGELGGPETVDALEAMKQVRKSQLVLRNSKNRLALAVGKRIQLEAGTNGEITILSKEQMAQFREARQKYLANTDHYKEKLLTLKSSSSFVGNDNNDEITGAKFIIK